MPHSLEQEVAQMGSKWKIRSCREGRQSQGMERGGRCLLQQVLVVSAGNSIGIENLLIVINVNVTIQSGPDPVQKGNINIWI